MEDFINQRLGVDGCKRLSIIKRADGAFEASVVQRDGKACSVDVQDSPADALWNALVPHTMRRRVLPSGRTVVADEDQIDIEDFLAEVPKPDLLEDLL